MQDMWAKQATYEELVKVSSYYCILPSKLPTKEEYDSYCKAMETEMREQFLKRYS
jgi:hypothetical protein